MYNLPRWLVQSGGLAAKKRSPNGNATGKCNRCCTNVDTEKLIESHIVIAEPGIVDTIEKSGLNCFMRNMLVCSLIDEEVKSYP